MQDGEATVGVEPGHVGLFHEQCRPDRDRFIRVNVANIQPDKRDQFAIQPSEMPLGDYDCGSIMHYGPNAFQIPTMAGNSIDILPGAACAGIGQRAAFSAGDIESVRYLYGHAYPAGAEATLAHQTDERLVSVAIGRDGRLTIDWKEADNPWNGPVPVGAEEFPAGAPVAVAHQEGSQLVAVAVDAGGRLQVARTASNEPWSGPVPVAGLDPGFPAGAWVSLCIQTEDVLTALAVSFGRLYAASVVGTGAWSEPTPISEPNLLYAGKLAVGMRADGELLVMGVDADQQLNVASVRGTGPWSALSQVLTTRYPAGVHLAVVRQGEEQLTLLGVDVERRVSVVWLGGDGVWRGPVAFGGPDYRPGSSVAAARHTPEIIRAVLAGHDELLSAAWVEGNGPWQGPVRIP
ncbi:M12 family metallopeptidase [Pseudonocardia sp. H11422]|uniref:M12 family metallopeptidase n=1 Tax=Pseudonocardia sp. H11422 TaxID=2835866 RepID=UPI001BDC07BF|nr:M12 family metallopeptidase [Pseudonocardia sp. H11422]